VEGVLDPHIQVSYFILFFNGILPGPGEYMVSLIADGVEHYSTPLVIEQAPPETL